jgi:hypothetical protein
MGAPARLDDDPVEDRVALDHVLRGEPADVSAQKRAPTGPLWSPIVASQISTRVGCGS